MVRADGDFSDFKPEFASNQVTVLNYDATDKPANLRVQYDHFVSDKPEKDRHKPNSRMLYTLPETF